MGEVFIGREALSAGRLTRHELQQWYRPIFRGIHVPKHPAPTLRDRTRGGWLSSARQAVIAGVAASALHGAEWVDADVPIELIGRNVRPQRGLVVRNDALADDEMTWIAELPVTTSARSAFDMGRNLRRGRALARMDALMRAAPYSVEDVLLIAKRRQRPPGIRQLRELLPLVDGGAASPRETRLRLLFIDAGLPKPTTQIRAVDNRGRLLRTLDMGWEEFMVAAEYDGDQHQTSRGQYLKDMYVLPQLERLGWIVVRAVKEHHDADIIRRAHDALISRGWKP